MTSTMKLLTVKQVAAQLGCSVSFVWKLAKNDPAFPKALNIGIGDERSRGTRWVESAVVEWLLTRQRVSAEVVQQSEVKSENRRSDKDVHPSTVEEVAA